MLLPNVLDYQERTRQEREQVLDQMTAEAEETELYDATATSENTRWERTAVAFPAFLDT